MMHSIVRIPLIGGLVVTGLAACGDETAQTTPGDPTQVPPAVSAQLDTWLTAEPWTKWRCEPTPRPARLNSPHGLVRVCENDLLHRAPAGAELPVGAAAVKEMHADGKVWSYTIAVRGRSGAGREAWFWWRKVVDGSDTPAITNQGFGEAFCSGCHAQAASNGGRDYVFTTIP